ncbi:hypothetical protein PAL_GLEAN10006266 [Pteropus alecto]|uniref:Uncharacterized protein n=1 Tax=Pteropus alecto TaxID=9402 RepID=L5K9E2_PTEAL|nr:hypothetical protein PAL_GLEAN10006266 [Pteropus alecto]
MEDDEEEITAAALRGRPRPLPISALSAFSYVPPRRLDPKEHSYYYRQGQPLSKMDTGEAGTPSINLVASNPLRLLA